MNELLVVLAMTTSGLVWNNFGYFSAWRKHKDDDDWDGFDKKKLRNDLILGAILGVGSYFYGTFTGNLIDIADANQFIGAVIGGFGLVAAVDKFIVGGILSK